MQYHKDWVREFLVAIINFGCVFCSFSFLYSCFPLYGVRYIERGQRDAGLALFESESLRWPGYVEFDNVNAKVLTFAAQDR